MEVWYPVYRLREAGCKVTLVGPEAGHSYPSKLGYPAKSDKAARDVSANDFDLLVIPGGFAPDYLRRHEAVLRLVSDMAEQGKVVAADLSRAVGAVFDAGAQGQARHLLLRHQGRREQRRRRYVDEEVVRDGNLITSRKPDDLPAFMQAIIQAVREAKPAVARRAEDSFSRDPKGTRDSALALRVAAKRREVDRGTDASQGLRPVLADAAPLSDRGDNGSALRSDSVRRLVAGLARSAAATDAPWNYRRFLHGTIAVLDQTPWILLGAALCKGMEVLSSCARSPARKFATA